MDEAILLVNLGSPDSPEPSDVKKYLDEFLMDKHVIDLPYLLRYLIIKGIILNVRPKRSAEAYSLIWTDKSPLIDISEKVREKLSHISEIPVELSMRYGSPSIESTIEKMVLEHSDLRDLIICPLYPHYAMASTKSVIEHANQIIRDRFPKLTLRYVDPFYNHPGYISVLSKTIEKHLGDSDYLLFSYHGIPVRHVKKMDPNKDHCFKYKDCCHIPNPQCHSVCYPHQVKRTTECVANALSLERNKWSWAFQSRLGFDEWLGPSTEDEIERLAKNGVQKLAICCPSFIADCLETLEEIGIRGNEIFIENGGREFTLIPCLNDDDEWVSTLSEIIKNNIQR